jgi:nitrogen regulatory protein A
MGSFMQQMKEELERLLAATGSDFAAYAAPDGREPLWRWVYACGGTSDRLLRLAVRPGRGIAGAALRTGRAVVLGRHRNAAGLRMEDTALLLAERLESVAAAPVLIDAAPIGLVLLGSRSERDYDQAAVRLLTDASLRLAHIGAAGAG